MFDLMFAKYLESLYTICFLETFMGVDQRTGEGTKPRIPLVVSKSHRNHGTATTTHRTLGLTPVGTMCRSNLFLGFYPILMQILTLTGLNNHLTKQHKL